MWMFKVYGVVIVAYCTLCLHFFKGNGYKHDLNVIDYLAINVGEFKALFLIWLGFRGDKKGFCRGSK